jgi:hypothetical protein
VCRTFVAEEYEAAAAVVVICSNPGAVGPALVASFTRVPPGRIR